MLSLNKIYIVLTKILAQYYGYYKNNNLITAESTKPARIKSP